MKRKRLKEAGVPPVIMDAAHEAAIADRKEGKSLNDIVAMASAIVEAPLAYIEDACWGEMARQMKELLEKQDSYIPRKVPAPWRQWGKDLEPQSIEQLKNACEIPVAVQGALMPDAHLGYGLPIGGVLATKNAVIPYAVGVDIACRVNDGVGYTGRSP
jgi:tRNA-splicing ligase RtcB (3'-phosphate/5'-hydroxy nucleic acid ligase)